MKVRLSSAAEVDLVQAVKWQEKRERGLGSRFLDLTDADIQALPFLHRRYRFDGEYQVMVTKVFKYNV